MKFHHIFLALTLAVAAAGQNAGFANREPRYRIQPSDVLEVHYRYSPEFDQSVTVQPDGFVSLQLIGDVRLQGLTLEQSRAAILERAGRRLRDPEITVVLKDFEKPYFMVGGEVANPGRFEMRGQVTAVQAIAMAGGFKAASAKHSQVILFRRVGSDLAQAEILDLKAALRPSNQEALAALHPGDLLVAPQNRLSKIERIIKWANVGLYWNPLAN